MRLCESDAGAEPPENAQVLESLSLGFQFGAERRQEFELERQMKVPRGHTDHGKAGAIDDHRTMQHFRVRAEALLPQFVAEHNDAFVARLFFVRRKPASERRPDAEEFEKPRRNAHAGQPFGWVAAQYESIKGMEGGYAREAVEIPAPFGKRARSNSARVAPVQPHLLYLDESISPCIGQRAQQNRVYHGENRGVCADAKREREQGDGGESWIAAHLAQRVARVLAERRQEANRARVAAFFLYGLHTAEKAERLPACFFSVHPRGDVRLDLLFDVKTQLLVELAITRLEDSHRTTDQELATDAHG